MKVPVEDVVGSSTNGLDVRGHRTGQTVRIFLGRGPGEVEVTTTPAGYTFVVRSLSGNVFLERKRGFGIGGVTITCRKRGVGVCPASGSLTPSVRGR
jgi:hypothetical protein